MEKINKSVIEEAKQDMQAIKDFALKGAKKELEEQVAEALKKIVDDSLEEGVTITAGDATIEVEDNETISVEVDGEEIEITPSGDISGEIGDETSDLDDEIGDGEEDMISVVGDDIDGDDMEDGDDEMDSDLDGDEDMEDGDDEMDSDLGDDEGIEDEEEEGEEEDELEENKINESMELDETVVEIDTSIFEEEGEAVPAPAPAAAPEEEPAPEAAAPAPEAGEELEMEPEAGEEMGGAVDLSLDLTPLYDKIDALTQAIEGQGSAETPAGEGEIEIVDDEATGAEAPVGEPAPAPVQESGIMELDFSEAYEIYDDNGDVASSAPDEIQLDLDEEDEYEVIDEMEDDIPLPPDEELMGIEGGVVGEDEYFEIDGEEDAIEEMLGVSFSARKRAERRNNKDNINESIAHYESDLDELRKENESLQKENGEFRQAFVELRQQINEMQTFNAKLAYVNKVLFSGGLTGREKAQIAKRFDAVGTIKEAETLYKTIIKEGKLRIKKGEAVDKIKSTSSKSVTPKSTSQPIYESTEIRRMKELAGIIKEEREF